MIRRLLAATLAASIPLMAQALRAAAPPADCSALVALTIPDVTVNAATIVAAGGFTPPNAQQALTVPAFCRVEATARPTSDSEIKFEVWIPPAEAWNGKFQGVGNGGYQGSISYAAMANALRRGYAAASTDTGHTGDDVIFGQGHPEKVIDFGHRAIHVMTTSAKLIVRNATGRFAERSYFVGCSSGGHQALSEAQRYPDDYDGIVAGAPANDRIRQTFGFLGSWLATHSQDGAPLLTQPKLAMITTAAVAACDANDGLKDGLIDDPRHRSLHMFNHIEYDTNSLSDEYWRDRQAGKPIELPANYFPKNDPNVQPENRWRSHAHLLFGNWINELYQSTPYDMDDIGR